MGLFGPRILKLWNETFLYFLFKDKAVKSLKNHNNIMLALATDLFDQFCCWKLADNTKA